MHGWTDPIEPEPAARRAEPPTDEPPYWDNGRPMPRSTYLFGDPAEPADGWTDAGATHDRYRQPVADEWRPEDQPPGPPARPVTGPGHHQPFARPGHHQPYDQPFTGSGDGRPRGRAGYDQPFTDGHPHRSPAGPGPAVKTPGRGARPAAPGDGRHRSRRRLPRPLLITGAAATATLVVAVGVGAALLPGGDETGVTSTATSTGDVPPAPPLPGVEPLPSGSPSPGPSPTTATPTPSPSRTAKPTPAPSRATAPSRRAAERSAAPAPRRATTAATTAAAAPVTGGTEQAQIVALVNAERAKAGCGALTVDDKLTTAAQRHSEDQAATRKMSHTGSDGSNVGDRLARVGYAWRGYGENVAWNQSTPAAVMDAWMNSSGHRANILNCSVTEIGVGVARSNGPYWTQVFGTPR
ncbi:CAP domain-containing protein [Micromonospora sp. WMMD882]|uniref:CAP domain-containing protein n=1 Tax=Micromonospora sp. WMMD882 TaxID=3015151 RepID=UPI00248CFCFF|nr:CAP domain-containing protein [Micromonospora sp. WMMD882]WBB81963.1 CAP domain-containing protein [Micromonospora sp. WMMD882]